MTHEAVSTGGSPWRILVDGVEQDGTHDDLHKAQARGYRILAESPDVEVVLRRDSEIRLSLTLPTGDDTTEPDPDPEPTDGDPTLPHVQVVSETPTVGRTVRVTSHAELDAAFADRKHADEIVLAGDVGWGQVVLPDMGDDWAILRGEGDVPPPGERLGATDEVTTLRHGTSGGFLRADGASGWHVVGIRGKATADIHEGIALHDASRIVLDRVGVRAAGDGVSPEIRRGVTMNGEHLALRCSRVEGIIRAGRQSQGVGVFSGAGPYLIEHNFIEALNQNILVGGSKPASLAHNPSDGTIRRNHFYTRPSWRDETGTIMVLEWKAGERWLAEENVVENDFFGWTVGVKAPSESQGVEGQRTGDLTLRRNRYIGEFPDNGGYFFHRGASSAHREDASRFLLEDELWGTQREGRGIRLLAAPDGMIIRRVTCHPDHASLELIGEAPAGESPRIVVESYRVRSGTYGLWLTDAEFPEGFQSAYPDHVFKDFWQYWEMDGDNKPARHNQIPESLSEEAQAEFHDTEFEADIPAHVGADASALPDPAGIRDPDRPE